MPKFSIMKFAVAFALVMAGASAATLIIAFGFGTDGVAYADTRDTAPIEVKLAAGQKLVDVSWHCFGDYPCAPFILTRAMRKDETSEAYAFSSLDPDIRRAYVIKESR